MRDGCLAEAEYVIDVGLEGASELLVGDFEDIGLALLVGRIVHQEIQSTELLEGLADHLFAGGLAADVGWQVKALRPAATISLTTSWASDSSEG